MSSILEALKKMEFVQGLEPHHLVQLASTASEVTFEAGQVIFQEGAKGHSVYLIQEGRVAIEMHIPGRGRVTILTVGPGHLLGWSPMFLDQRMTATGRAVTLTRAIAFEGEKIRKLCQENHELGCILGWRVAEVIAGRLKATRLQLLDIFAHGEEKR